MIEPAVLRPLSCLLASVVLIACTGSGVREGDSSGGLGGNASESPGDLYVQLAVEYLKQGQIETALSKARKALAEDPDNAQAHIVLALIYQRLRQHQLAENHFQRAIGLKPEDPYVLNAYASYLCDRRQFAQAQAHYQKALENPLYPAPWVAMTNMGTCAKRSGNRAKAQTHFQQALRSNPRFGPTLVAMAELHYSRARYKSARGYLDRYFKLARPTAQALLLAVRVERKLGSRERAQTYAQMLRKSYPGSYEALQLNQS